MVKKYLQNPFFLAVIICSFIFYSGIFSFQRTSSTRSLLQNENICFITGQISSNPSKTSSQKYYSANFELLKVQSENGISSIANGTIMVLIPAFLVEAYYPGKLFSSAVKQGANLYETGGYYSFSGEFKNNIFIVQDCRNSMWKNDLFGKLDFFRALCRLHFKRLMYSWGYAGGLLLALLCGAREYTDTALSDCFRKAGLSHILALSGMHLSMFSSIAVFFGNRIGRKKITYLIRIITLIIFVWFAGFSPSLLRAFICSVLSITAIICGTEEPDLLLILCFSFIIQILLCPNDVWNTGFILSYGALLGILLTSKSLYKVISKVIPNYFSSSLSASSGAQIFTAPISLKYFGSFSPVGVIATTIISPLITFFIYSGVILIILNMIFPSLLSPSGIFMNFQYNIINFLVSIFSKCPQWSLN